MFRDLSFRYKIPLRGIVLIWITATVVSGALIYRAYTDLRRDIRENAESLAGVLADSLITEISHDDVWRAFSLVSATLRAPKVEVGNRPEFVVVLDNDYRVFVSTHPERFPLLKNLPAGDGDFSRVVEALRDAASGVAFVEPRGSEFFYLAVPVVSDQLTLGTLVLGYPRNMFEPRFRRVMLEAGVITAAIILAMLPFTWYWGSHLADPLIELAGHMRNAANLPDPESIRNGDGNDEIGELRAAFKRMLVELREKQGLEQQVVASDRLAALGRLSAGIAHEINNPLGGMLNAVNTLRSHSDLDPREQKTLGLIERGLNQIRETVGALLVEAKISRHPLTADDLEDVRMLIESQSFEGSPRLVWRNGIDGVVALPSTQLRQVLLNLMLNACQAASSGGRVWVEVFEVCTADADAPADLVIDVANEGVPIPEERLPYLFEPFATRRETGSGLGLWVSYQIVRQLGGSIDVTSEGDVTRFRVTVPIPRVDA